MGGSNEMNEIGMEWPYPIKYGSVVHVNVDVLVVGGGLAGSSAGIAAARRGAKVAVADKAPIKRSGCGGAGMDHFNAVLDNPKSPLTVEGNIEKILAREQTLGHREYIAMKGTWNALQELEKLGLPIRDIDDDFKGKPTVDDETKLLKAYIYDDDQIMSVKLRGGNYIKPVLFEGLKQAGAQLFERVMVTSLLTENGKQGARIAGATGFSMQTGEFYVFHAKSVIISSGYICSCWIYNLDISGNSYRWDPNEVGDGLAMAWNAGAKVIGMERAGSLKGQNPFAWPRHSVGTPGATWFPITIVDNQGKEVPWVNGKGEILKTVEERNKAPDDYLINGWGVQTMPMLIRDLPERIQSGEYELPLWADFAGMPEEERRSIWGLMVGNEGKTRYTVYDYYTRWGFNPDRDMIMCPFQSLEAYREKVWFMAETGAVKPWRSENGGQGEIASDWNLMTSVEGLYAAGASSGLEGSSFATSSGFYAGNRAAEHARGVDYAEISEEQLQNEIARVYAPVLRSADSNNYISWKELWGGSARVMQQCCQDFKTLTTLKYGLLWLNSIKEQEMTMTYARNPHELARVLEGESRITCSEAFLMACIAKIEAEIAGIPKDKYIFNQLINGEPVTTYEDDRYWLKGPWEPSYLANYENCRALEKEEAR